MKKQDTKQEERKSENEILKTFSILLPKMTESEKEILLAFGEGMVLMSGMREGG